MVTYTLEIDGTSYDFINVTTVKWHPNPDCDTWFAHLPFAVDVADEAAVNIKRDGVSIFKGLVEERTLEMGEKGVVTKLGGRHEKVKLWRNWIERNEDPKSGGFWYKYYPHDVVQFYLYPSKSDIEDYHISGWGIDPKDDWVITTNPAGSFPNEVKNRLIMENWHSGVNQADGHYVEVDLGSAKDICAIRVENREDDLYPEHYRIQYSANGAWGGEEVNVKSVLNNAAHNIVHAWTAVSARYWRIVLDDQGSEVHPSNHWTVGEIYLYEEDGTITGISEGTLNASHAELDEGVDFTYMRRTDAIQGIVDLTETANVIWSWWVNDDGSVDMASRRGTDKSADIQFVYSVDLKSDSYKRDSKMKVERIKVLGKGSGNDQDNYHASGWIGTGDYEKVVVEKNLEDVTACTTRANVLVNELKNPLELIRCTVKDEYASGSWGVGDDITLTDAKTGLSGSINVKKITRKYDGKETVMIECSNYRETVTNKFIKVQKALEKLNRQQDEFDSVNARVVDRNFITDLFTVTPAYIELFKEWNTNHFSWTIAGTGIVEPDIVAVDNYPALRIRTNGNVAATMYIGSVGTSTSSPWYYATKMKLAETSDNIVRFGLGLGGQPHIYFQWDDGGGGPQGLTVECDDGVGNTSVTISNFPDLTEWHIYRINWLTSSKVDFYIDELLVATITTDIPTTAMTYKYYIVNTPAPAAVKTMYIRSIIGQGDVLE